MQAFRSTTMRAAFRPTSFRTFATTRVASKSMIDSAKDTLKETDRKISDQAVKGIDKAVGAKEEAKATASGKAEEMKQEGSAKMNEAQRDGSSMTEQAKQKASEMSEEAKQKGSEVTEEAKQKADATAKETKTKGGDPLPP